MYELHTKDVQEKITLRNLPTLRQAFLTAALIIIAGYLLAYMVHPGFLALPLLVAGGLFFSGATGVCPMALILQAMPWNRKKKKNDV